MKRQMNIKLGQWELAATLHVPEAREEEQGARIPVVVICHGFVGNRIGTDRLFVKAAKALEESGFAVLRFDYAGCGESEGDYGQTGMGSWIDQTRYALDTVLDLDFIDHTKVALLGHSLGGAVAVATAAVDKRVNTLVLWAPVGHPFVDIVELVGRETYDEAVTKGAVEHAGYSLSHSFFQSLAPAHPLQEAKHFAGDVFLVHGTSDPVISVDYSFLYQKVFWTRGTGLCDKEIITGADHTFSTKGHSAIAIGQTVDWLKNKDQVKQGWYGWMI